MDETVEFRIEFNQDILESLSAVVEGPVMVSLPPRPRDHREFLPTSVHVEGIQPHLKISLRGAWFR